MTETELIIMASAIQQKHEALESISFKPIDPRTVLLDHIQIRKGERNRGIGTKVFKMIAETGNQAGTTFILYLPSSNSQNFNRLRKFYNRLGFTEAEDAQGFLYFQMNQPINTTVHERC